MAAASYLQDEDQDQRPFYLRDPEDDTFDTGDPADLGGPSVIGPPRPAAPTPQLQAILRQQPRPDINGAPEIQNANKAREELATAKANMPVPPQPKWWQRLGAGIIGGVAGYANASGHRGVHIDPTAAEQGIMGADGYQRELAKYQAGVTGAQAKADAAQSIEAAWWKNRQLQNQEELQQAQAERDRAQAEYNAGRNNTLEEGRKLTANEKLEQQLIKPWGEDATPQKETDPVPPGMEVTRSITQPGMVYVHPPRYVKIPEDLAPYASGRKAGDLVPYSEFKRAQATAAKLILQKPTPEPKPRNLVNVAPGHSVFDPETNKTVYTAPGRPEGERRPPTSNEMRGIEQKKGDRLNTAEQQARRRIEQGEDKDTVHADLEAQKQRIQDEYEGEIQAATGSYPGHLDLASQPKPVAAQAVPPAAPKPSGGGRGAPTAKPPKPSAPQQQIAEGTIVINKQTGERLMLKGGQWVPAPAQ